TVNGGKQKDIGVEALIKYTAYESDHGCFRSIKPFANIAYSHFRYENFKFQTNTGVTSDYSGLAVGGVPKWTYNLGVDVLTQPGIYGNVNFFHKSAVPITSDGVNWTGSYSLLNTKLGYQHSFGGRFDLDLFFGIGNLAGTRYPIMVFVNQLPDAYIPAPPKANFYGGVNFKFIL
ncbi:MAG TPA: TonB-dependent receptor, partial [Chitinophagaceae bacterium]|nr:TonB-dependent receptor [Chitinophagaceae bacterium]